MANNYINMWNNFASKIDPNILRQRIFEEAERINNTFRLNLNSSQPLSWNNTWARITGGN